VVRLGFYRQSYAGDKASQQASQASRPGSSRLIQLQKSNNPQARTGSKAQQTHLLICSGPVPLRVGMGPPSHSGSGLPMQGRMTKGSFSKTMRRAETCLPSALAKVESATGGCWGGGLNGDCEYSKRGCA